MLSMTGFGLGEAPLNDSSKSTAQKLCVEIRGVNHRFLEVRVRLPAELQEHGAFVEQCARERLKRGRYDIGVRVNGPAEETGLSFNYARARALYQSLSQLRDELAPGEALPISSLSPFAEWLLTKPSDNATPVRAALESALLSACSALQTMRATEGAALHAELKGRTLRAKALAYEIQELVPAAAELQQKRLRERVERLLTELSLPQTSAADNPQLLQELILQADKSDITEELVRLESHFNQFLNLLDQTDAVGRRLDFLLQEMNRESNTIGAKSQHAKMSHLVVELKAELERLREQVQNVE